MNVNKISEKTIKTILLKTPDINERRKEKLRFELIEKYGLNVFFH